MKLLVVGNTATPMAPELRACGYEVEVAGDGVQAIAFASDRAYDAVILDLNLPRESSLLVLHEIRESDREVEILILSAPEQIHDRVTALIQGASDYLVKPFTPEQLDERLRESKQRKLRARSRAEPAADSDAHLNNLIENLLSHCNCRDGEIELVISEIKLAELLHRVSAGLQSRLERNRLRLNLPEGKMPTLLVDARWTEHLFANLLANAISHSPENSEIDIGLLLDPDYCSITIENRLSQPLSGKQLKKMFGDCRGDDESERDSALINLSLAKNYADCMNLELHAARNEQDRFCVWVSNIKIV